MIKKVHELEKCPSLFKKYITLKEVHRFPQKNTSLKQVHGFEKKNDMYNRKMEMEKEEEIKMKRALRIKKEKKYSFLPFQNPQGEILEWAAPENRPRRKIVRTYGPNG